MSSNNHNMIGEPKKLASCTPGPDRPVAAPVVGAAASTSSGSTAVPNSAEEELTSPEVNGSLGNGEVPPERAGLAAPGQRPEMLEAEELLRAPNLLDLFVQDVQAAGVVGEEDNIKRLLLVAVSRLLPDPLGAIVKASAGAGKSNLVRTVLDHVDKEQTKTLTRLSAKALGYMDAGLKNKLVYLGEAVGAENSAHELRELFSEKRLAVQLPDEELVVEGPIAFITTTTAFGLDGELESRMFELSVDESDAQTERIVRAYLAAAGRSAAASSSISHRKRLWGAADRMLRQQPVDIPGEMASRLLVGISPGLHGRRTASKLASAVMAHVLLHQRQRAVSADGLLIAQVEDVEAALDLFGPVLQHLPKRLTNLAGHLADHFDKRPFAAADVALKTGRHPDVVRRELKEMAKWGIVTTESPGKGKRPATWKVVRPCHKPTRRAAAGAPAHHDAGNPGEPHRQAAPVGEAAILDKAKAVLEAREGI